jgi:hypothetical protein
MAATDSKPCSFYLRAASERAIELIGRAVSLRPGMPAYHATLAEAHLALGQYQQSLDCMARAGLFGQRPPPSEG